MSARPACLSTSSSGWGRRLPADRQPAGLLPSAAALRCRLAPDARGFAFGMVDVEGAGLADQIAQLTEAVGAGIEIRREIGELRANHAEPHPAIVGLDLFEDLVEDGNGRAR